MQLQDNVFFVTGGASGLGEATARMFVESGARVVIADLNASSGNRLASELGSGARFAHVDVTDEASVRRGLEIASGLGTLRGLVNAAGIVLAKKVLEKNGPHALDDFTRVIHVNLAGTFNVIRLASSVMSAAAPTPGGERGVFRRMAEARRERRLRGEAVAGGLRQARHQRRIEDPRRDRHHAYAVARELACDGQRHSDNPAL